MKKKSGTLGIIPARYQSSRFPGKPLALLAGRPMIRHVYERALRAGLAKLVVATDDERIARAVQDFGGSVRMTDAALPTGTDRCAAVAGEPEFEDYDIVVNIQGDEPLIHPDMIRQVAQVLEQEPAYDIGTLLREENDREAYHSPHTVKAVTDTRGRALYFSRAPIPSAALSEDAHVPAYLQHVGIYAFRREVLRQVAELPTGRWEGIERLEQLRWLEHGLVIGTARTMHHTWGVDTPEDLDRIARRLADKS